MPRDIFPLDVHTDEASSEIQYGNVKRPTHSDTPQDFARFGVCVHKWLDVSEYEYGVSFLNDCKHGCSVKDGMMGLTMLKSPLYPSPDVDKEKHKSWYSTCPHKGDWREADMMKQAYLFNSPLMAAMKSGSDRTFPPQYPLVSVDADNTVIEVVKQAEDGRDVVLRMYECFNQRTGARLTWRPPVRGAAKCSTLEAEERTLDVTKEGTRLSFMSLEIRTVKLMPQSPQRAEESAQIQHEK